MGAGPQSGLAVLPAEDDGPPAAVLADAGRPAVGQLVVAIGNPLGLVRSVPRTSSCPSTAGGAPPVELRDGARSGIGRGRS